MIAHILVQLVAFIVTGALGVCVGTDPHDVTSARILLVLAVLATVAATLV